MTPNTLKTCTKCKNLMPLEGFSKNKLEKDGKHCWCKKCCNEDHAKRALKYQENLKANPLIIITKCCGKCKLFLNSDSFGKDKNRPDGLNIYCKLCCREISAKNKDEKKQYDKIYNNKNRLKKKAQRDRYRPRRNTIRKEKRKTDPVFRFVDNYRRRINKALKGALKAGNSDSLIGCSYEQANSILESKFPKGSGWSFTGEGRKLWHVDHRRPASSFDFSSIEQQKICFHISNLQPLSGPDNMKKKDYYDPREFENEWIVADGYRWRICDNVRTKL